MFLWWSIKIDSPLLFGFAKDKRGAAYGQTALCFYDEYNSEFGKWRLVAIGKERLSFGKLTEILKENGYYKATIDPRKGS